MFKSLNNWIYRRVAPWYIKQFKKEVSKLSHENTCAVFKGPYRCNCAKRNLEKLLWDTPDSEELR